MRAALFAVIAIGFLALVGTVSLIVYDDYFSRTNMETVLCEVRGYVQKGADPYPLVECDDFFGRGDPTRQVWKDARIGDKYACIRARTYFDTLADRHPHIEGCARLK
jgi:hypothetical protein